MCVYISVIADFQDTKHKTLNTKYFSCIGIKRSECSPLVKRVIQLHSSFQTTGLVYIFTDRVRVISGADRKEGKHWCGLIVCVLRTERNVLFVQHYCSQARYLKMELRNKRGKIAREGNCEWTLFTEPSVYAAIATGGLTNWQFKSASECTEISHEDTIMSVKSFNALFCHKDATDEKQGGVSRRENVIRREQRG